jgi:hypothetical protein
MLYFWQLSATFVADSCQKEQFGAAVPPPNSHRISPIRKRTGGLENEMMVGGVLRICPLNEIATAGF